MTEKRLLIKGDQFELGGNPWRLIGGAIHYPRVPRPYWEDRLRKLIDLGCNTVETYGFWNAHEPYPGQFDFTGMLDVASFIELAGSLGLNVIFRPGPYICAEWDMGGLPWWLINEPGMQIRSNHPGFLAKVERYWIELMHRLAPLQSTRGGPIIAMQIENEYGYFGHDPAYLAFLRDLLRRLDIDVLLFTSDGTFQPLTITTGGLDGTLRTANFGSKPAERLAALRAVQPGGPLVCMEFWVGWFDEWRAAKHATRPAQDCAKELDDLLAMNASAVIYMFHGGTNWGFSAGGNLSETFKPFVTSYDYDALLTESGDLTPKYEACRAVIHRHLKISRAEQPIPAIPKAAYGELQMRQCVALHDALNRISTPICSPMPMTMEQLGHGQGFVLYQKEIESIYRGQFLVLRGMHDWCHVRLNGKALATWYRLDEQPTMLLEFDSTTATLEILVHNLARSNFGHRMLEAKGITQGVFVGATRHDERALMHWQCYSLPLRCAPSLTLSPSHQIAGPAFYQGSLQIDGNPADTFIALPAFHLGCVFINGFNIGRYWNAGPQLTLYVPGAMLRPGVNEIMVFEAEGCSDPVVEFVAQPQLDRLSNRS